VKRSNRCSTLFEGMPRLHSGKGSDIIVSQIYPLFVRGNQWKKKGKTVQMIIFETRTLLPKIGVK